MLKKNPRLSIVIPTMNSVKLLPECLDSIAIQTYKNMEIVIADGKSKDNTLEIAKKYKTKIINNPDILAEPGIYYGMKAARGELIMIIAVDNILRDKNALSTMVSVFNDKKIFAAFPKHDSTKDDSLFTKYTNTFTDPFNHVVYGYAANNRTFHKVYKTIEHNKTYDIYDFSSKRQAPILALAQGFTVRKSFVNTRKNMYDDISPIISLIRQKKLMAYVHSVSLIHHTLRNLNHFWRKQRWASKNFFEKKNYGFSTRTNTLTVWQKIKAYTYPLYSISIIFPLIISIIGLIRDKEKIWLFHPIMVFVSGLAMWYEFVRIKLGLSKVISRL